MGQLQAYINPRPNKPSRAAKAVSAEAHEAARVSLTIVLKRILLHTEARPAYAYFRSSILRGHDIDPPCAQEYN